MNKTKQTEMNKEKAEKMKIPTDWEEIESPNFFKFEKKGDTIMGILQSKEVSSRYGFGLYTIRTFENEIKRFHGSSQLDDLLLNVTPPNYVKIEFTDEQDTPAGTMKIFKVSVGKTI